MPFSLGETMPQIRSLAWVPMFTVKCLTAAVLAVTLWPQVGWSQSNRTSRNTSSTDFSIRATMKDGKITVTTYPRPWTDLDGEVFAHGKLTNPLELDQQIVVQIASGETVTRPVTELSKSDLHYLSIIKRNVASLRDGSPRGPDTNPRRTRGSNPEVDPGKWLEIESELEKLPVVELTELQAAPFKFDDEPKTGVKAWTVQELPEVQIAFQQDIFMTSNVESRVIISNDGRLAALGIGDGFRSRLIVFDLKAGTKLFETDAFKFARPLAFNSNKSLLAVGNASSSYPLQFWRLDANGMQYGRGYELIGATGAEYGAFLDDKHFAFAGFAGVSIMDITTDRILATSFYSGCNTNGGLGYVLATRSEDRFILDVERATARKTQAPFAMSKDDTSVSPDGRLLAHRVKNMVTIYDLKQEKRLFDLRLPQDYPYPVQFLTNRYLIVGADLLDLKHQALVARFAEPFKEKVWLNPNGYIAYVAAENELGETPRNFTLVTRNLLPPQRLADLESYVAGEKYKMEVGSILTLDLEGLSEEQQEIIETEFKTLGLRFGPGGEWVYRASARQLPQKTMEVNTENMGTVTVTFQPTETEIQLLHNGKVFWEQSGTFAPGRRMMGFKGETPQTTANRLCRPAKRYFIDIPLPIGINLYAPYPPPVISIED